MKEADVHKQWHLERTMDLPRAVLDLPCITPGTETLFRQAPMTAHDYMMNAIDDIDELIAAYMQTAAIDFGTAIIARAIESISTVLDNFEKGT